ncbi:MAG: alpha/beta fold hydrolase [Rubrivivax sp.]|nr:alpha/beta fold hydrolase [Rubrivivax sp.]
MQTFITLGGLLLAALWALTCWRMGCPAWGLGGAAIIVGGYAAVLGLEFTLLRLGHGDDPTPKASPAQLLRAWWGEVRAAPRAFCWRQPFMSHRWPDHLPAGAQGRRGLLLVHGFVCNRGLWNPWLRRLTAQGVPLVAVNLEPVFGSIDDYISIIEEGVRKLEDSTGVAPVVVCHSMGGLALRRWWVERGEDARVHHAVTLGTPHHGTWLARFALTRNAQQMRRASRWLLALASTEPSGRAARFTCFYSHCDNIVFPPATATLAGADNRHLPGVAHVQMVDCPEPWQTVQQLLRVPAAT